MPASPMMDQQQQQQQRQATTTTRTGVTPDASRAATLPPAIILGGDANALSVARSLSRLGVRVHYIGEGGECARHTRHCRRINVAEGAGKGNWEPAVVRYLLGPESDHLAGAVVIACSDSGLELLLRHGDALAKRYRLDESDPGAQMAMLDKLETYRHAIAAGIPTPKFWIARSREQIKSLQDELVYPLIVKPRLAHRAKKQFTKKHQVVRDFAALLAAFDAECDADVEVVLMEEIPGGDDTLCSYYTYMDADGNALFDFTKRVVRRYPVGMGLGCYHVTDHVPDIGDLARRLLRQAGLRGLAAVEFKRDPRDGKPKLIECNARFTAANGLVAASGVDIAAFVYRRAAGLSQVPMTGFRTGLHVWDPMVDLLSFMQLRRMGKMTLFGWLRSLMHRQTFAFFRFTDPMPAAARTWKMVTLILKAAKPSPAKAAASKPASDVAQDVVPAVEAETAAA